MRSLNLVLTLLLHSLRALGRSRSDLILENLALRQQVAVFTRTKPRAQLEPEDRILWVALRQSWSRWRDALAIVKPETVVTWHRSAFRRYWTSLSKPPGRPKLRAEIRALVVRMASENSTWGAPRIHGELLKLGLRVSQRTVSRYLPRDRPGNGAGKEWLTFLRNHREVLTAPECIRSDNGSEFTATAVREWLGWLGVETLFIEPGSPWENGYIESFNGKLRDELLDREIFYTLREAQVLIERWRREYNTVRPHSALGYRPPAPEAVWLPPTSASLQSAAALV